MGLSAERLPLSVQLVAPRLNESLLFRAGTALEADIGFDHVEQFPHDYLGQLSSLVDSTSLRWLSDAPGPFASPRDERRHLLEVDGFVAEGAGAE